MAQIDFEFILGLLWSFHINHRFRLWRSWWALSLLKIEYWILNASGVLRSDGYLKKADYWYLTRRPSGSHLSTGNPSTVCAPSLRAGTLVAHRSASIDSSPNQQSKRCQPSYTWPQWYHLHAAYLSIITPPSIGQLGLRSRVWNEELAAFYYSKPRAELREERVRQLFPSENC